MLNLGRQSVKVGQIAHPQGTPPDFIFIGRPDTSLGRPDFAALRSGTFSRRIQILMNGQNKHCIFSNFEVIRRYRNTLIVQGFNLGKQCPGINHNSIADNGNFSFANNT